MSAPRSAGPFAAITGGVVLTGGLVSSWVRYPVEREVGGVPIAEQLSDAGTEFAGAAMVLALAALLLGLVALVLPRARRGVGALLFIGAVPTGAMVGWGVWLARDTGGELTAAPGASMLGWALVGLAATLMRFVPADGGAVLDERYTVEGGEPGDEEWQLSSEEPDEAP